MCGVELCVRETFTRVFIDSMRWWLVSACVAACVGLVRSGSGWFAVVMLSQGSP